MENNKFEYSLNAIHYSIWLNEKKNGDFIGRIINKLFSFVAKCLFTKEYRNKYNKLRSENQKEIDDFFYDKENGFHIGWAHHWYSYFYSGYSLFFSFIFGALALRASDDHSTFLSLVFFIMPVGLCYIPAYMAVFFKDKYLKYFKQFEKKDKRWHMKWKWITVAFCVGSVITMFLGICAAFAIVIL